MSGGSIVLQPSFLQLGEWAVSLGEEVQAPFQEKIKDGILLCKLMNRIKPGSIEEIKPRRSSGDAEENILRFLQACTTLGIKKIFRPSELVGDGKDMSGVLVTLQLLYKKAADLGMGLKRHSLPQNETEVSPGGDSSGGEAEEGENGVLLYAKAVFAFNGTSSDELQFNKGDLITVTNIVDGGWWEGLCNGQVGWFPGNYVEELPKDVDVGSADPEDDAHHYYRLVVQDILESERVYVQDIEDMLSTYLLPLKTTNVITSREVDQLTGNLPELARYQPSILKELEDCSRLPVPQQNMGAIFLKCAQEVEALNIAYCANHPKAVAVLTDNSDKLSAFMESKGSASPGMLTLTSNLSKPFRRLEKYLILLKELQRHLMEGHSDTESVEASIEAYKIVLAKTREIRKKKEMENEMLSNPVKGYNGSCLNELGDCKCVITARQALNSEEVDEVYFLVFPSSFVILAVGPSLSGYEIKNNYALNTVSLKKAVHSEQWPWPVEITYRQETIHASLSSDGDQRLLLDSVTDRGEDSRTPTTPKPLLGLSSLTGSKALSRADSAQIFRTAYPTNTRRSNVNIQRPHHWGFKSLRPAPPLKTQQLVALKERDKSPKAAKKFNYPNVKKKRASKHMEEMLSIAGSLKVPVENKPGDNAILRVIEAYCAGGGRGGAIHSDQPVTYITRKGSLSSADRLVGRSHAHSSFMSENDLQKNEFRGSKSSTLPGHRSDNKSSSSPKTKPSNLSLPGFPYRPPSPILLSGHGNDRLNPLGQGATGGKVASSKRSLFRRRAESVDTSRLRNT